MTPLFRIKENSATAGTHCAASFVFTGNEAQDHGNTVKKRQRQYNRYLVLFQG